MIRLRLAAATALALTVSACVAPRGGPTVRPSPSAPPTRPTPSRPTPSGPATLPAPAAPKPAAKPGAVLAGVQPGPAIASLSIDPARARAVLAAFRLSCPGLMLRADGSGLTQPADWQPACAAAMSWPDEQAPGFFARYLETAQVGDGRFYATGYYEPEIAGSLTPGQGYDVPIYGVPDDLVEVDLGKFTTDLRDRKVRGRVQYGALVPYADRTQIEAGALGSHAPIIGYAADKVAFFFLQIQGSGRLRLPDGQVIRIGYAAENGQPYTGIGKWMVQQGLITVDQGSMQGIVGWLKAHPDQADMVMRQNRSFIFFKQRDGAGPLGAMGVPVAPRTSVAADPAFTPLGAPVWLGSADRSDVGGLWIAQDTGGAIKGANRFDTFWGAGDDAARIAGGMSARGQSYLLLPVGTVARAGTQGLGHAGPTARP
jgi:membrane-bound lytic murein transglycosylase A